MNTDILLFEDAQILIRTHTYYLHVMLRAQVNFEKKNLLTKLFNVCNNLVSLFTRATDVAVRFFGKIHKLYFSLTA